jgi:NAD-dependent epimerase/dehydratase family protein
MARKALVIGAQGVLGSFISPAFADAGWEVTRAGRRPEGAPDFLLLDVADRDRLGEACRGVDLIVNTAHHPELVLERAVLSDGGTLIDLAELSEPERARLRAEATDAQGLVVVDTGLGGVGYLAVAELLREHPEADAAEYALMFSASGSSGRAGALLAHGLLTGSSHHLSATIPFPDPLGPRRSLEVGPDTKGVLRRAVREVPIRHYLCMQPRALQGVLSALNTARLISVLPTSMFTAGSRKVPAELSGERVCEWVAVSRGGERLASLTNEGEGYYRMTVAATLAFADALVGSPKVRSRKTGLLSIDELVTLPELLPTLEDRGIAIRRRALNGAGGE